MIAWTTRMLAWCLLALMLLSVAPRVVLHHCDEHHVEGGGDRLHATCAVSDHALPAAEPDAPLIGPKVRGVFVEVAVAVPALAPQRTVSSVQDRGPPFIG